MKEKFKFIGKSLYFENGLLVVADLHIGYEEALNKVGVLIPRTQFKETISDLNGVFDKLKGEKIKEIVVLGDLKHEFGTISSQEWREVKEVLDFFKKKAKKVVLVKGNHDTILGPIAARKEVEIKEYYVKDGICFIHGHKLFSDCLDKEIKMMVLAHRHPAIALFDDYKKEKYKCFLKGKWKSKEVIIMPSFFPFVEWSDVVNDYYNHGIIEEGKLKDFDVYVVGDKVYKFGKVRELI